MYWLDYKRVQTDNSAELIVNGIVFEYPLFHIGDGVAVGACAGDDILYSRVYYRTFAHCAGGRVGKKFAGFCVTPNEIERAAEHGAAGGGDDRVCLSVDASAKLITLAAGDEKLFAGTKGEIDAIGTASGSAIVSGGYDLIVVNDDRTVFAAKTGGATEYRIGISR